MDQLPYARTNDCVAYFQDPSHPYAFDFTFLRPLRTGLRSGEWNREVVAVDKFGHIRHFGFVAGELLEKKNVKTSFGRLKGGSVSEDGQILALVGGDPTAGEAGVCWLWNLDRDELLNRIIVSQDVDLLDVEFIRTSIVIASVDGTLRVWDVDSHQMYAEVVGSTVISQFRSADARDTTEMFTHGGGVCTQWLLDTNLKSLKKAREFAAASDVTALATHPLGRYVVSGHSDGSLQFVDFQNGEILRTAKTRGAPVRHVVWADDSHVLATSREGGDVYNVNTDQMASLFDTDFKGCWGTLPFATDDPFDRGPGPRYAVCVAGTPDLEDFHGSVDDLREFAICQFAIYRMWYYTGSRNP